MFTKLSINHLSKIMDSEQLPYSIVQIKTMLSNNNYLNIGFFLNNELVSYAFVNISEQVDLIWIYTYSAYRKQNHAIELIKHIMKLVDKPIMVEVNQNNIQAINLYKKMGFKQIDIRKNYYPNNEDALIMQWNKKCD